MLTKKRIGIGVAISIFACVGFSGYGRARKTTAVNGIHWYNSLADARAEAKRADKPILFLSMFGRIDEELPCANARTLRATLFKDPAFVKLVNNDVIPAWEMVRPVPKIEIDLGDGKKIKRTVRGNAVMYLLNSDGKVVDAFPGIYTAKDFIPEITEDIAALEHATPEAVREYHQKQAVLRPSRGYATFGKAVAESPTLDLIGARATFGRPGVKLSDDAAVRKFQLAAMGISDLSLNPIPATQVAATIDAIADSNIESATSAKDRVQRILDTDSTNNIRIVRPVIHLWLASLKTTPTPDEARDTVLESILKIPYKDPYFGLKDVIMPGTPQ